MLAFFQANDFQTIWRQAQQFLMPEIILTVFACAALVLDVMLPRKSKRTVAWVCLAGIGATLVSLYFVASGILGFDISQFAFTHDAAPRTAFFDMMVVDV